jgi:prepilin-type N-terminal cleavage/methylation domain-containing protein
MRQQNHSGKCGDAFTLIELLVVIAIIAVLAFPVQLRDGFDRSQKGIRCFQFLMTNRRLIPKEAPLPDHCLSREILPAFREAIRAPIGLEAILDLDVDVFNERFRLLSD